MRQWNGKTIFETRIDNIPCYCVVLYYSPEIPPILTGPMEDADPGADLEFEYMLLDSRYIRAPWLQKQVDYAIDQRLVDEYECAVMEFTHYINER